MKGSLWSVVVIVCIVVVGMLLIPTAISDSADEFEVVDEEQTLSSAELTTLDEADDAFLVLEDSETVTSQADGTVYERGEDYEIFYENGTIAALEGSPADGDEVLIDYEYNVVDEQTEDIVGLFVIFEPIVPILVLATMLGAVLAIVTGWW